MEGYQGAEGSRCHTMSHPTGGEAKRIQHNTKRARGKRLERAAQVRARVFHIMAGPVS